MRILHAYKDYFPPVRGEIEQHIHDLTHSIEGFEFAVLTSSRSRRLEVANDAGVRVIRTPEYARVASTAITPRWRRLIREAGAHLLHFHMPNPFGELMFLAARGWTPMIATYHSGFVGSRGRRRLQRRFLDKAQRIVVSSERLADGTPALKEHRDRVEIIPFGVDPGYWGTRPQQSDEIRGRHPIPIVLFSGALTVSKGVEYLIEAMRSIEGTLLVAGDGPMRTRFEAAAVHHRVRRRVVFLGEASDEQRRAYCHAADVFVLPSISPAEGFGIAMLEAMACGLPPVCTEVGTGTTWVNLNGKTGLVVAPRDPAALAGAVKALLADDQRRADMGAAAQARVREQFPRQAMLEAIASLYRSF